jgi:TonB family protein
MSAITYQTRHSERLLWICVAGSILLHALVMWQMHGVEPEVAPVQSLRATIRVEPRPIASAPPQAAAPEAKPREPPKAPPEPPKMSAKPVLPSLAPRKPAQSETEAPTSTPPAPQPAPAAAAAPTETPVDAKSAAPPDAAKAAAALPALGPGEEMDHAAVIYYQTQLQVQTQKLFQKMKVYNSSGKSLEGHAVIKLHIGVDGKIAYTEVMVSSGNPELDARAQLAVARAKPFVPVPGSLRGKSFESKIPFDFHADVDP